MEPRRKQLQQGIGPQLTIFLLKFEISHSTVQKIVYGWRTFPTTANTTRSDRHHESRPQDAKRNLILLHVGFYLSLSVLKGRCSRRKCLLSKNSMKIGLKFASKNSRQSSLWTFEFKADLFGLQNRGHVWHKSNTAFQEKNVIQGYFVAVGHGQVPVVEPTLISNVVRLPNMGWALF
uniref:Uncharacterized protein n=1 Tax=Fundulus heteroclitus TaxID=8078 RepID=A0A3Q2NUW7_FUNHE